MKIAQIAPLYESVPPKYYGGSERIVSYLTDELVRQVGERLGEGEGVLVFDPSAFAKSGQDSVGVGRQWCGRLGKVDNCQVAVYMGYVSRHEHALVDTRLFLPKAWALDPERRQKAGVPPEVRFRTRHQLCLEMLQHHGDHLPHAWITGDDEMGRPSWFRHRLDALGERYLLAVPSNTQIRDLQADPPAYAGRGRQPKRPWTGVEAWGAGRDEGDWTAVDVRDGAKRSVAGRGGQTARGGAHRETARRARRSLGRHSLQRPGPAPAQNRLLLVQCPS